MNREDVETRVKASIKAAMNIGGASFVEAVAEVREWGVDDAYRDVWHTFSDDQQAELEAAFDTIMACVKEHGEDWLRRAGA